MRNRQAIAKMETAIAELPAGYDIKIVFPKAELYFDDKLIGTYDQRKYAVNAAEIDVYNRNKAAK